MALEFVAPRTPQAVCSRSRLSIPQDVLYGLRFIACGETKVFRKLLPSSACRNGEFMGTRPCGNNDMSYEIDKRSGAILLTLTVIV